MKYLLFLLFTFLLNILVSADWISETYSTVTKKDTIELPDGSIYSNFEQTGQGTSNLGKYVITKCSGNRLDNKGKLVEINVFCELEVDDGNKYWTKLRRTTGDSDAGVSKFTFLGGTNSFNKLKGKECTYAVSYFKNKIFGSNKCQISDELFAELKK
tara:strand:+ start:1846 stop:2316 length:471 start_codon:yes stop_codon:yes gene_type:complete